RIYGMITAVDENLARLLGAIDAVGARDNTLVIFMTDNGGTSAFEKVGLRGHKMTVYEGGIRVPFFARWPGRFPAGAKVDALTSHLDVMPTLCELVGQPLPNDRPIDGRSVLTLLREGRGESPHR